jgi:hypothetical protein
MNPCTFLAHKLSLVRINGKTQLACDRCDNPWRETLLDNRNTPKRLQAMNVLAADPALDEALKSMEQMFGELQKESFKK